jgi:peptidoglycan/LPS O-acetylase OafA/YrhL
LRVLEGSAPINSGIPGSAGTFRLAWVDRLKGISILWIFLNHASERLLGGPLIGNPYFGWPSFEARLHQLAPLRGYGVWNLPLNLFRYVGWTGDDAVGVFLLAAGFSLTWSLFAREQPSWTDYYRRRVLRIYPSWWLVHAVVLAAGVLGLFPLTMNFVLSALGLRFTSGTRYLYVGAWWFIPLILQLYAVFPLLWFAQRRWGPWAVFGASIFVCFVARGVGLVWLPNCVDPWLRGTVFVTRLAEFILGMALAGAMRTAPQAVDAWLRSRRGLGLSAMLYAGGTALALSWWGMIAAPLALTAGASGVLYPLLSRAFTGRHDPLSWAGRHSLSLFLVHHPFITAMVPKEPDAITAVAMAGVGLAFVASVIAALALESVLVLGEAAWRRWGATGHPSLPILRTDRQEIPLERVPAPKLNESGEGLRGILGALEDDLEKESLRLERGDSTPRSPVLPPGASPQTLLRPIDAKP